MLRAIINNIKGFFDLTIFWSMLVFGVYTILVDYKTFKRVKYTKDAAITMTLGIALLVVPIALLLITILM